MTRSELSLILKTNSVLCQIQSNLAEPKSELPETVEQVRELRIRGSLGANRIEAVLLLLSLMKEIPEWESDRIYGQMAQQCYRYRYEGEWKVVQALLETKLQTPEDFYLCYTQFHSPEEFFGNLVRETFFLQRCGILEYVRIRFNSESTRPVRRKVRRRGYSDKGTLRFRHEQHGDQSKVERPREDRRSKISNSLAALEFREQTNFRDGDCAS